MQQDGEGVQEVIVAALKDVHNTDQATAHVPPHLDLSTSNNMLNCPVCDLSEAYSKLQSCMVIWAPSATYSDVRMRMTASAFIPAA